MKYSADTLKKRMEYYYNIINSMVDADINLDQNNNNIYNRIYEYLNQIESNDLFLLKNYISEIKSPWSIKGVTNPIKIAMKNNYLIDIIDNILEQRLEAVRIKE